MIAPARAAAFRALRLAAHVDLGEALVRTRDRLEDVRDRALVTELVTGTLRWRGAIDYQLERLSARPLDRLDSQVLDALRLGAYQLLYLQRVPASAVVNDSVNVIKKASLASAAPLVNAVLRRLARERSALPWPSRSNEIEHLSVVHSHPRWLVARWVARYGLDAAEQWLRFNNAVPVVTLATNRLKTDRDRLRARLASEGVMSEPTLVAPHGLRVTGGRPTATPAFAEGWCLVQDESSQLIPELVAAAEGGRVLDACAAPGGKTVALAAQVGPHGRVVATDVRAARMQTLRSTLARCGAHNVSAVHVSSTARLPFGEGAFDAVMVDAPCSGLGTVRRDPDIKWKRSPEDLQMFAAAQLDLLRRLAHVVRPGGRLVYSTCSSEPDENEAVVNAFLAEAPGVVLEPIDTAAGLAARLRGFATPQGYFRSDPARHGLEAFFAAVLRHVVR